MKHSFLSSALFAAAAIPVVLSTAVQAELSGSIGVVSKYVFRGITNAPENNSPSLQGSLEYAHESGVSVGWWGSNLGYGDDSGGNGFEHDFYLSYSGSAGSVSYGATLTQFYYMDVKDADLTELNIKGGFDAGEAGSFGLGITTLLQDGSWGNAGDAYMAATYEKALPKDFTLGATLGYYFYDDSPSDYGISTTESSAFRHLDIALSHPIGKTGADMGITYVLGGKDRTGVDQDDTVVVSLSYDFDI